MSDEALATAYKCAPAAKTLHHAFVGGLLDHVVSLFTACATWRRATTLT